MIIDELTVPIVLAPMAGGPSTPELTAAVAEAGGLGVLAAGYLDAETLAARITETATRTRAPIGVNLFVPDTPTQPADYDAYLNELRDEFELGEPSYDTDAWDAKLALLTADPVAVVSFTFGCPTATEIAGLHAAGSEVWVTVTDTTEADKAIAAGADVLVAQGAEAGGHRATFVDRATRDAVDPLGVLTLVQLLRSRTDRPVIAAGGIATGAAVAAVITAGAAAAQVGTAFLRCPEAGTNSVVRQALDNDTPTLLTRAFTGRRARGVRNRFITEHSATAPVAYPEIHYATAPLRAAARNMGDPDAVNIWAGQAHSLATQLPAGELVHALAAEAKIAAATTISRWFD